MAVALIAVVLVLCSEGAGRSQDSRRGGEGGEIHYLTLKHETFVQ